MGINGSSSAKPVAVTAPDGGALDVHAHAMPLPLLERLAERGLADLGGVPDGIVRLDPRVSGVGPMAPLPLARSQYDVDVRLSEMDDIGVRRHAVSLPPFLFCSTADDRRFATGIVAEGNDELATYVADAPDRLLGLGSVPLGWPDAAEEARRALDELGLAGIAIGSRGGGRDLDDPVNDELWALLSERRTFVFLHPSGVPDPHRQADFWLPQLVGYPMETALSVARLVFGRVLERFPLNLCLAHGGGCLPSLRGRLNMGWDRKEVARTTSGAAQRVHRPALLRHGGVLHDAAAPAGRGRRRRARAARHRPPVRAARHGPAGDGGRTRAVPGRDPGDPVGQRGRPARPAGLPVAGRPSILDRWPTDPG